MKNIGVCKKTLLLKTLKFWFCEIASDYLLVLQQYYFQNDKTNACSSEIDTAEVTEDGEPMLSFDK